MVVDPQICFAKPSIRGHRVWVSLVLGYIAEGRSPDQVVEEYPGLPEARRLRRCARLRRPRLANVRFADLDDVA